MESKRKYFISDDLLISKDSTEEEDPNLKEQEEYATKVKYRNENVLMFEFAS